jgi:hypothetical protein
VAHAGLVLNINGQPIFDNGAFDLRPLDDDFIEFDSQDATQGFAVPGGAFIVDGTASSETSPALSLVHLNVTITATKNQASGFIDFSDLFAVPLPLEDAEKSAFGTFIDAAGDNSDVAKLDGFIGASEVGAPLTFIDPPLNFQDSNGITGVNEVDYILRGRLTFTLSMAGDSLEFIGDVKAMPAAAVPEGPSLRLALLGLACLAVMRPGRIRGGRGNEEGHVSSAVMTVG